MKLCVGLSAPGKFQQDRAVGAELHRDCTEIVRGVRSMEMTRPAVSRSDEVKWP